ncbi:MAG: hypothetical protein ACXVD1_01500 [Nocardioides sp.]
MISLAVAVAWLWLGMVLAISFLEAPLKFRVVDIATGLGIGRVVFRALNAVEGVLAVLLGVALVSADPGATAVTAGILAIAVLVGQLLAVRPALTRRSDAVLAGTSPADAPRSHAHYWYVGLEVIKVAGLLTAGIVLL